MSFKSQELNNIPLCSKWMKNVCQLTLACDTLIDLVFSILFLAYKKAQTMLCFNEVYLLSFVYNTDKRFGWRCM